MSATAKSDRVPPQSAAQASSFDPFEQAMRDLSRRLGSDGDNPLQQAVLSRLLQHTALRLTDALDAPLRPHGLNSTLWTALVVIYSSQDHELMPSALSVFMNSSRTNITRVSRELTKQGFVRRIASAHDGRQVLLQLTGKGRRFVEDHLPLRRAQMTRIFAAFDAAELKQFEALARKLLRAAE